MTYAAGMGLGDRIADKHPEHGIVRMGHRVPNRGDRSKSHPESLVNWRVTSRSRERLVNVADLFGGEVVPWPDAPTGPDTQWQVYTTTATLPVFLPPGGLYQAWELWTKRSCLRVCDDRWTDTGEPCQCPLDLEERARLAATGGACKPMTRLSVMIAELGVGTWRVNTGGQWAARELSATVSLVTALSGQGIYVPGTLSIDARESAGRHGDKPHQYVVPVLDFPDLTIPEIQSGRVPAGAIVAGSRALPLPEPQALDAGPAAAQAPAIADAAVVVTMPAAPPPAPTASVGSASELVERLNALPNGARLACHRRLRDECGFPRVPDSMLPAAFAIVAASS